MEMVINAVYYNPLLTLQILESQGWTNKFFSLWFSSMDAFSRVHDKKLCIVAIVALISIPADQIPPTVAVGWPRLLQGITSLFSSLPTALKNREEALKDDYQLDGGVYDENEEWDDDENNWDAGEEAEEEDLGDIKGESEAYLEFLNEEVSPTEHNYLRIGIDDFRSAILLTLTLLRRRSFPAPILTIVTTSSARMASFSNPRSTSLTPTPSSRPLC